MAISWSGWSGPTNLKSRIGIDLSVSGTTITAKVYFEHETNISDNQELTISGGLSYNTNYTANISDRSGGRILVATRTVSGSRGETKSFKATISGIYNFNSGNGTITVSDSIKIPAVATSAPGTPTISGITHNSMALAWSAPTSNNGDAPNRYQVQRSTTSNFSSGNATAYTTSRSYTGDGLVPGTTYYWRVRAENEAGWSSYSGSRSATTYDVPGKPANPTFSNITDTTFNIDFVNPSSPGLSITSVEHQVATDSGFTDIVSSYRDTNGSPTQPSGFTRATTYYVRIRGQNAAGYGPWSNSVTVRTASTVPDTPTNPTVSAIGQVDGVVNYQSSYNGGSPVTQTEYQIALNAGFTSGVRTVTDKNLTGLTPGTTYYVRVREINEVGSSNWSTSTSFTTLTGMRVKVNGQWVWGVVYVKRSGQWVPGTLYKKNGGVWTM